MSNGFGTKEQALGDKQKRRPVESGFVYRNKRTGRWNWCLSRSPIGEMIAAGRDGKRLFPVDIEPIGGA